MTLQFRRGTDSDRLTITPSVGEPIYTTDTKSLYIGDGSTAGGTLVTGSGGVDSASTQAIIDSNISAIGADLLPAVDSTYDLGSASKKWKDLHLSGNSIFLGGHKIIKDGDTIKFTDSTGATINVTAGNVAASLIDSSDVVSIVDSAYINARTDANLDSASTIALINAEGYTKYDSTNASGQITTAINNLIDAAPASLDTLNELAAALNDDANFAATVTGQIAALPDSAQVATIVTSYGYTTYDSSNTLGLIDSAYITARASTFDSDNAIALIDSNYVQARQTTTSLTGGDGIDVTQGYSLTGSTNDNVSYQTLRNIRSIQWKPDGTKLFVFSTYNDATGRRWEEHTLTTAWDISTASDANSDFYVGSQTTTPTGAGFSENGLYFYVVENSYTVYQYTLSTAWDVSTASYTRSQSFYDADAPAWEVTMRAVRLNGDGTKIILMDNVGSKFGTFDLSTAYDISSRSSNAVDVTTWPTSGMVAFNFADSGSTVYTTHSNGYIYKWSLSTPYDMSTVGSTADESFDTGFSSTFYAATVEETGGKLYAVDGNSPAYVKAFSLAGGSGYTISATDSYITGLIDSAYINARTSAGTDSATVVSLITSNVDSAYVQARQTAQDFAYSSLTGAPNVLDSADVALIAQANDTTRDSAFVTGIVDSAYIAARTSAGTDSATVSSIVTTTVDSAYVQLRQTTVSGGATTITTFNYEADSGQTTFTGADIDGSTLTYTSGKLNVYLNGILLVDSNDYTATNGSSIVLNTGADSADIISVISYISQAVGTLDSAGVTNLIDSAYIQARQVDLQRDSGFVTGIVDSAYINARVSATDSATVSAIITADVDAAFINALTIGADSLGGQAPSYYLDYNNFTNTPTLYDSGNFTGQLAAASTSDLSEGTNLYYTTARHDSDFDARLTAGTGVTISSGQVSIGQSVGTTDSVEFGNIDVSGNVIVGGNLQVTGTTTTVNSENLNVTDNMIYLNAGESAGSPTAAIDVGWAANINDDGSYTHVGMFRDATDNTFKVFGNYTPEPDASVEINTGHASFTLAPFAASTLTGQYQGFDSDVTAAGLATQTYVDNAVAALPDSAQVATIVTSYGYSTFDSTNATGLITSYGYSTYDSTNTLGLIDSAYIQARQVDLQRDSAFVTGIIDSAYINARVSAGTDSATVISLIQSTVDSAYVQLRDGLNDSTSLFTDKVRLFNFTADSGQTTFSGLTYTIGKIQVYLNGILLRDSDDYTATDGSSITLTLGADSNDVVSVVGHETLPVAAATTINTFNYEADSGQTTFTGADIDGSTLTYTAGKLNVYLNGILLVDSNDYTATNGSSVVLNTAADSSDVVSVISYITQSVGTLDSTGVTNLIDSAYVQARQSASSAFDSANATGLIDSAYIQARQDFAYSSLTGAPTNISTFTNDAGYTTYDSGNTTGMLTDYRTVSQIQSMIDSDVAALVDAAPATLDTLNELAAALNDDANFASTVTGQIAALPDSAQVATIVTSYGYTTYDSTNTLGLIDSAYINARTSAGTDSATVVSLITSNVDSAYVQARQATVSSGATTISTFNYEADSGQTTFTGADIDGSTLTYTAGKLNVYLNGILLVDSNDYTATNGSSIVLNTGADSNDVVSVISYITTSVGTLDSAGVTNLIDSAYITARASTYDSGNFTGQLTNSVLRGVLDDSSLTIDGNGSTGGVTIEDGGITIRTGTGNVAYADFYCEVTNAHRTRVKSAAHADYSGNVDVTLPTSTGTLALTSDIPTAVSSLTNDANYLDSTTVLGVIDATYIQANQTTFLDSALTTQLTTALVDSAYVQARQSATGGTDPIFKTISVSGQSDVVADTTTDTLTLVAGSNITITTDAGTDTITFASSAGGGGLDSAATNTLIDAKLQVLDVSDVVGADGNYGEYLKSLGNGEAEWTDLATQAKQKAFAMALIFG